MNIVDRVKNIIMSPKTEWPKIAGEAASVQSIYLSYVVILAAIGPVALLVRSLGGGIVWAVASYVMALVMTFILSILVDLLSPSFGGSRNLVSSTKLVAYSYTAAWLAGIFFLLGLLGGILTLIGGIYSIYLFYLGAPVLNRCSREKTVIYMVVVLIAAIIVGYVLNRVVFGMIFTGLPMPGMSL